MISQSEFHRQNNESRRQNYPESVNLEIYYFYSKKYKVCSRKTMNQGGGPYLFKVKNGNNITMFNINTRMTSLT